MMFSLPPGLSILIFVCYAAGSGDGHAGRLTAFGRFLKGIADFLTFAQGLEALRLDHGVVDEDVYAVLRLDKTVAFCIIEPLHFAFCVDHWSALLLPPLTGKGLLPVAELGTMR